MGQGVGPRARDDVVMAGCLCRCTSTVTTMEPGTDGSWGRVLFLVKKQSFSLPEETLEAVRKFRWD